MQIILNNKHALTADLKRRSKATLPLLKSNAELVYITSRIKVTCFSLKVAHSQL